MNSSKILMLLAALAFAFALALVPACAQDIGVRGGGDEDASSTPRDGADAAQVPNDDATSPNDDATSPDDGAWHGSMDSGVHPDASSPSCAGDPFVACPDPAEPMSGNNEWSSASDFNMNMTVGCLTGDNLTTLSKTISSLVCPSELADYYDLTLVGCDTRTMFAELRLHLRAPCDAADVELEFRAGGGVVACDSGRYQIQCLLDGGDEVIRLRIPPKSTVFSWQFGVISKRAELRYEYDLTVTLQ